MASNLKDIVNQFIDSIAKIHLLGVISEDVFLDFPANIPAVTKDKWKEMMNKITEEAKEGESIKLDFNEYGFMGSILQILGKGRKSTEFEQVILRQDLVGYMAYLEAFMQDIYRFIFVHKPELLPEEKEIKWKEIAGKSSVDEILNYVINKQLEKSGYDKVSEQIVRLNNKPFLFKIKINKKELDQLNLLAVIRNIIVHNGSKANKEYLELKPDSLFSLGETVVIKREEINDAHVLLQRIAYESYASLQEVIHGIDKTVSYHEFSYTTER